MFQTKPRVPFSFSAFRGFPLTSLPIKEGSKHRSGNAWGFYRTTFPRKARALVDGIRERNHLICTHSSLSPPTINKLVPFLCRTGPSLARKVSSSRQPGFLILLLPFAQPFKALGLRLSDPTLFVDQLGGSGLYGATRFSKVA